MKFDDYVKEAVDKETLEKRILKAMDRTGKLMHMRYSIEDEIEKIQKQMKKAGIKEIRGMSANADPSRVFMDWMA